MSFTVNDQPTDTKSQNVMFSDQNPSYDYKVDSNLDETFMVSDTNDASLQNFMSRPLKVASYSWGTGSVLFEKFNPWDLFFENPRVINRISNFQLMRAKLKVKIVLNGNGFHYGRAIASYVPLHQYDDLTVDRGFFIEDVIQASQRPHVYLDPTLSQGGELSLPFFWLKNYLNIPKQEWKQMGEMIIHGMQPLKHANGATDQVTISVFVWAEDVHLSVPTGVNPGDISPQSGLEPHAGVDEYGTGPISRPASMVAKAAGALRNAPVIGAYAKVTQVAASAVSTIAQVFGYSRPVSVDPIQSYKPVYLGNLANTNMEDTSTKLTTDVKQELTVDPRVAGLSSTDEMVISDIAKRESYLCNFPWAISSTAETRLFSAVVDPGIHAVLDTGLLASERHLTAASFACQPFKYWRGSMDFRFQVVSSNYHKGRLKIVYEPFEEISNTTEYNTNYTYIVDIAESKDFTIKVGWGQEFGFKEHFIPGIPQASMFTVDGTRPGHNGNSTIGNGFLSVFVVNELTVPNSSIDNDIAVNVFVSMCDDFEVAAPEMQHIEATTYLRPPLALLDPQSGVEEQADAENTTNPSRPVHSEVSATLAPEITTPNDHTLDVYFGETIESFRALLKRYCLHQQLPAPIQSEPAGPVAWYSQNYYFPFHRGYDENGFWEIGGQRYSISKTTLLNYLTPAYAGFRGGIRWKTHLWSDKPGTATYQRCQRQQEETAAGEFLSDLDVTSNLSVAEQLDEVSRSGGDGMVAQASAVNPVLEFEVPSTTPYRFLTPKDSNWLVRTTGAKYNNDTTPQWRWDTVYDLEPNDVLIRSSYCAAGDDFSAFFFTGAPILYRYFTPSGSGAGNYQDVGE